MMVASLAGTYAGMLAVNISAPLGDFAWAMAYMGLFGCAFGAMSLFISSILDDGRKAAIISLGVMIVMFFMQAIGSLADSLGIIQKLSLFHYAGYSDILMKHQVNLADAGIMIVVAVVFLALAVVAFGRRDINVD
jgi:ABC-2 type transport system permease protein